MAGILTSSSLEILFDQFRKEMYIIPSNPRHRSSYKVVVVGDCTIVHREEELPGGKEGALRIIRNVLKGEVISLEQVISKYLGPK